MLNDKDKIDIVAALKMFVEWHCGTADCRTRCGELIKKVQAIATLDKRTVVSNSAHRWSSLADRVPKPDPLDTIQLPTGWKVGVRLKNKRHGWEGVIVAPIGRNGLINVDVGIGVKVGEHWSDWDFVCGPEDEDSTTWEPGRSTGDPGFG